MRVDRHDEANALFSRFGDRAPKCYVLGRVCPPSDLVIMKDFLRRPVERENWDLGHNWLRGCKL